MRKLSIPVSSSRQFYSYLLHAHQPLTKGPSLSYPFLCVKLEILKPSCFLFCISMWKDCIKMHSIESRFLTGRNSILFAGTSLCTFQPRHLTDWGSEGVKTMSWCPVVFHWQFPCTPYCHLFTDICFALHKSVKPDLLRYNLPLLFYDFLLEVRKIGIKTHQVSVQTGHNHVQSNKKLI